MKLIFVGAMLLFGLFGCEQPKLNQMMVNIYHSPALDVVIDTELIAEQIFTIELGFDGHVSDVKGMLVSETMNMGVIPVAFNSIDSHNYAANTLVGACSLKTMVWRLHITWKNNGTPQMLDVPITVTR